MINKQRIVQERGGSYPFSENGRIEVLKGYEILDSAPESEYDEITFLASKVFKCPFSTICFLDTDRAWIKSKSRIFKTDKDINSYFNFESILEDDIFVVQNTLEDSRFSNNLLLNLDPKIKFYASAPIITEDGYKLGVLNIMDINPREITESQKLYLKFLANKVLRILELRKRNILIETLKKEKKPAKKRSLKSKDRILYNERLNICQDLTSHILTEMTKPLAMIYVKSAKASSVLQKKYDDGTNISKNIVQDLNLISDKSFKIANKIKIYKKYTQDILKENFEKLSLKELISNILNVCENKIRDFDINLNVTFNNDPDNEIFCKPTLTLQSFSLILNYMFNTIKSENNKDINIDVFEKDYELIFRIREKTLWEEGSFSSEFKKLNSDKFDYINNLVSSQGANCELKYDEDETCIEVAFPKVGALNFH